VDIKPIALRFLAVACICLIPSMPAGAQDSPGTAGADSCREIKEDARRLECYDTGAGRAPDGSPPEKTGEQNLYFSKLWELDEETRRQQFTIRPHRSIYALPFTYNDSPNVEAVREANPEKELKKPEVAFQLSLKVKLLQNLLGRNVDVWLGYTQRSFWQLYNFEDSSPFRETNYEPEFLVNIRTDYDLLGLRWRFVNFGWNHQSNGQSEPLSRSWNRIVTNFGFEKDRFSFLLKTWCRLPESAEEDDNPGIEKYLGYGELWTYYFYKKHRFGLMFRNNFNFDTNRGALQVEWGFPVFFEHIAGYLQYYNGYGESLLDYNHHVNRIGIGFSIKDWE
jgi:phospholipase A1